ncbi:DUF1499 domain-containing protein [Pseudalkalibacillus hwajinpoensis]|uniref:DUF1499 domain-containing protein n=1 Tax=Guptibacillus hwajinpoensis TaxID=208199 RepID=A0A4U1MJ60_9BACL|nr:DUF1499 domain-containing protein [Pseudalkalibacillus hwajinpoensis]TKD70512.1 DUF1499 domain-containing protein [Pseudalkalibacillus hwajinpoensis]
MSSEQLGVKQGKLAPCPDKPNCVLSQSTDEKHKMEPIPYTGTAEEALTKLKSILTNRERTKIVEADTHYIRAEEQSKFFKFVDDIEFYIDTAGEHIHFRSASRKGYSDFGVNKKRMEEIKEAFQK